MIYVTCPKCGVTEKIEMEEYARFLCSDPHDPDIDYFKCNYCGFTRPIDGMTVYSDKFNRTFRVKSCVAANYLDLEGIMIPIEVIGELRTRSEVDD